MEIIHGQTVGGLLTQTAEKFPERPAVEYKDSFWTYAEVDRLTDGYALGMMHHGIRKGTHIGLWAGDKPNSLFIFLALEKIGAVPVMLNASWNPVEVKAQAEFTDIEGIFFDEGNKGIDFVESSKLLTSPMLKFKAYIGLTEKNLNDTGIISVSEFDAARALEKERAELDAAKAEVKEDDTDQIIFTSGTTSKPKGVMTSHFSRVNIGYAQAEMLKATEKDAICVTIPIFHCFSMGGNIMAALAVGAALCFPADRHTDSIYQAVEKWHCTVLTAVPTLFSALLANKRRTAYDVSSLRIGLVGGAICPEDILLRARDELGMEILPSLGQSEATAGVTCGLPTNTIKEKATTVGYIIEHLESRIVDIHTGQVLEQGKSGELCIRGYNVMKGYYKRPELTKQTIDSDGWLHTGDTGWFDAKGLLHLDGRLKEIVIRGGENISPLELEDLISKDKRVERVKIIGIPDEHYGEQVCACIQLYPDMTMTKEEVQDKVRASLAAYKVPEYVEFLEIPLLYNGKIDVGALKKQVIETYIEKGIIPGEGCKK